MSARAALFSASGNFDCTDSAAFGEGIGAICGSSLGDADNSLEGGAAHYLAFVPTSSMSWRIVRRLAQRIRGRFDVAAS